MFQKMFKNVQKRGWKGEKDQTDFNGSDFQTNYDSLYVWREKKTPESCDKRYKKKFIFENISVFWCFLINILR